jgi:glycosyltransferase involved in cell wall biosynthesis
MRFSLLVPCYNAENYIDKFLENISALQAQFDEVIFYDDASTDNTYELLKSKGVQVIKGNVNKGPGYARNQLIAHTTCDWFHFHDIDDGLNPDYLNKVTEIAKDDQNDVILCNVDWYDAQSKELVLSWKYSNSEINQNTVAYIISHPIGGINGLYRKSKFIESGGFNTQIRMWEDADFHVRLAAKKARFFVIEEMLSYSLRYSESASADQSSGWLIRLGLLQDYHEKFTDDANQFEIGKQAQATASHLILCRQFGAAKTALKLSELCGLQVPHTKSTLWACLKWTLPATLRINLRLFQLKLAFKKT